MRPTLTAGLAAERPCKSRVSESGKLVRRPGVNRNIFAAGVCILALWCLSDAAVAQLAGLHPPPPPHRVPAPELDMGLLSFIMVGGAASLAYWRKRKS
jgi:hypothetical protein